MIITHEEMQRRLNSQKNLVNKLGDRIVPRVQISHAPMKKHTPAAPKSVRVLAASLVAQGESPAEVGKILGLTTAQVSSEKHNPVVQNTLERVRNLALDKMLIAMGLMTAEKFENATLADLAKVTGSLARVIEKTNPQEINDNRVQFIVHAPQAKSLSQYKTIDV